MPLLKLKKMAANAKTINAFILNEMDKRLELSKGTKKMTYTGML